MPLLKKWASRGRSFENYYSVSSTTQPAHATLLSGLQPWEHGVTRNGMLLGDEVETIAETLRADGFVTGAVVASYPVHPKFGFAQGFDRYIAEFAGDNADKRHKHKFGWYCQGETITEAALEMLDRLEGERQFLWFHFFDMHSPYGDSVNPESLFSAKRVLQAAIEREDQARVLVRARALYDVDGLYLDQQLNTLLERLQRDTQRFETHIVVVSDHGESFGEDGSLGHGLRLTAEQLRVPLFILSPRVEAGSEPGVVGSVDVAATLLSLSGVPASGLSGRDLTRPELTDGSALGMRRTFEEPYTDHRIDGSKHVLPDFFFFYADAFGLSTGDKAGIFVGDSEQESDVGDEQRVPRLRQLFGSLEAEIRKRATLSVDDPETMQNLEELGYAR